MWAIRVSDSCREVRKWFDAFVNRLGAAATKLIADHSMQPVVSLKELRESENRKQAAALSAFDLQGLINKRLQDNIAVDSIALQGKRKRDDVV